ncbi:MAG: ABC transporter permease [Bacteroidota bacterium]
MFKNYLLIALRNFRRHKLYTVINIFSLAIGIAACIVIYLFIADEQSFDQFHSKKSQIFRLDEVQSFTGTNVQKVALSMPGMGPNLIEDFPEIENYTRYWMRGKNNIQQEERQFVVERVAYVDSTFLQIFDYKLIAGDQLTALNEPNTILLTREIALKFFETTEEALNQTLSMQENTFKITGILEDIPENTHLQFDALVSMGTITSENPEFNDRWGSNFLITYLQLNKATDIEALEAKFPDFLIRQMDNEEITDYYQLFLQPLAEVHLASMDIEHDYQNYRKFNGEYLDVFLLVALFIVLIATVNFTNLAAARATYRTKEVGIRKTIGAQKGQIFIQFITEAILLSSTALILSLLLSLVFLPLLNDLINRELSLSYLLENPLWLLLTFLVTTSLGILSGIYPAFFLASFQPVKVMKGMQQGGKKSITRSTLIVIQFGLAMAMIVSTMVVVNQLFYMKNKDIGFDTEHIVLIDMSEEANDKFETLKETMLQNSQVTGVTASGQRLGNNFHQWGFKARLDTGILQITPSNVNVDYDYLDVYGIKLKEGRSFSKDIDSDKDMAFIINEAFAKELGVDEPVGLEVGHSFYADDTLGSVIGVTENFNFNSLHYKVNTLSLVVHPDWGYDELSVKIDGENVAQTIQELEKIWYQQISDWPFDYSFLDEHFNELYRSDQQLTVVVTIIAILAILIACMGLFGLAAITTERKIKEIGIRKVLGASIKQILYVLSARFTLMILIAFIISGPPAYLLLEGWLENFAYRVSINPLLFILGGLITMFVAFITISYHTFRSAYANPVNALRQE